MAVRNSEDDEVGFLSVARDIRDLKRTESELRTAIAEAHQASRAKGDFLAAMSHELRTPINGIIEASREEAIHPKGGAFSERLRQINSEDREDVIAAVPIFLKSCPKDILKLENAAERGDFRQCYFLAHTMKGVAAIFLSRDCVLFAEAMEQAAESEELERVRAAATPLLEAMRVFATEVEFAAI